MNDQRCVRESGTFKASHVLPPDTNNHNTLFGGKLMAHIDDVVALSVMKHARGPVVTASTDSVAEDLQTGQRTVSGRNCKRSVR